MFRIRTKSLFAALACLALALPLSAQCGDWQWLNPGPQGNRLAGVAYGRGLFVAVGATGTILTSPDGAVWTPRPTATKTDFESVAWNGSVFVAVGAGAAVTSPDGVTWMEHVVGTASTLRRAVWNGSTIVAVGDGGAILTSPDGIVWATRSSGTANTLRDVAWSGNRFVAVGEEGTLLASPDGATWAPAAFETRDVLSSVAWDGRQFVVSAMGFPLTGSVLRSADGMSWTAQSAGGYLPLAALRATSSGFVGVGGSGAVYTSPDAHTWNRMAVPSTSDLSALAGDGDGVTLVAVGARGTILTTRDGGFNWTSRNVGSQDSLADVAFSNGRYVAAGNYGSILTSIDGGASWTSVSHGTNPWLLGVASNGARWVAVGDRGTVLSSDDGTTWTWRISDPSIALTGVQWDGRRFVAVGSELTTLTSADGITWVRGPGTSSPRNALASNGSVYVAVGGQLVRTVHTSADLANWALTYVAGGGELYDVLWNGSKFVAVGSGGMVLSSADGLVWQEANAGTTASLNSITWTGSRFVAVGEKGIRLESLDAAHWSSVPSGTANDLYRVRFIGSDLFAVGRDGTILKGSCGAERAIAAPTSNRTERGRVREEHPRS